MKINFVNLIHTWRDLSNAGEHALNLLLPRYCAGCLKIGEVFCIKCAEASYKSGSTCIVCGLRNENGKICRKCFQKSDFYYHYRSLIEVGLLSSMLWVGHYDGVLREAIWQFKYKKRKELAAPLAEMMWKKFFEVVGDSLPSQQFVRHRYFSAEKFLVLAPSHSQGLANYSPGDSRTPKKDFLVIPIPLHFKKEYERGFNQAEFLAKTFARLTGFPLLTDTLIKIKDTKAQVDVGNKELRIKNLDNAFQVNAKISESNMELIASNTIILIDDVATTGATLFHAASALKKAGAKKIIGLVLAHGR